MSPLARRTPANLALFCAFLFAATALFLSGAAAPAHAQPSTIYVDGNAPGPLHDGTSWATAYVTLQDALAAAGSGAHIMMADGVYYPDEGAGQVDNDRTATFVLPRGVSLIGGYAGGETVTDLPDPAAHPTVLSGDIDRNDATDAQGIVQNAADIAGANAYHVLTLPPNEYAMLGGVVVTGGQADGAGDDSFGGGLVCAAQGSGASCAAFLIALRFSGNTGSNCGAIYLAASEYATNQFFMFSPVFNGNAAAELGGAVCSFTATNGASGFLLQNATFSGNRADRGSAIVNAADSNEGQMLLVNSIVWDNRADSGTAIENLHAALNLSYSLVQGAAEAVYNDAGSVAWGPGILDADPLFVDPAHGNFRLQKLSPAADAGSSGMPAPFAAFDADLRVRTFDNPYVADAPGQAAPVVDLGAYEYAPCPAANSPIYVAKSAAGVHDGASWSSAYTELQDGLALAAACPAPQTVWVAQGVYYPDEGVGQTADSVYATFAVPPGTMLYGGFAATETLLTERNWNANPTVLSGDLGQDDLTTAAKVLTSTAGIVGANAQHVLYLGQSTMGYWGMADAGTRIDGFTVTGGSAVDAMWPGSQGGGLYCGGFGSTGQCSPTLANVIFSGNLAREGGALFNAGDSGGDSSPILHNVVFFGNKALEKGGAIANDGGYSGKSSPALTNVTLVGNEALASGGAIYSDGTEGAGTATLTNVLLWGNTAPDNAVVAGDNAALVIDHSFAQPGTFAISATIPMTDGGGNLFTLDDPGLVDTAGGDLRLLPGSPAIDRGAGVAGLATDVRGRPRQVLTGVDIGAYEFQGYTLAASGGQSATVGGPFAAPLQVTIAANGEVLAAGSVITFTPPAAGPGLSVTLPFTAAADSHNAATAPAAANGLAGSYTVTATATWAHPAFFHLTNTPLVLRVTAAVGGAVSSQPGAIQCGSACTGLYDYATPVVLQATPHLGYVFSGWSGDLTETANPLTVTLTAHTAITATFTALPGPQAQPDSAAATAGGPLVLDVLANDLPGADAALTIVAVTQPQSGVVTIEQNRLVYTPAAGFSGSVTFTYTVRDANGWSSTATVTIAVTAPVEPVDPPAQEQGLYLPQIAR